MRSCGLMQFIREACSGCVGGRCVHREGPCVVGAGQRCATFEADVLPVATSGQRKHRRQDARDDSLAVEQYRAIQEQADSRRTKPCPDCGCPIPTRSRVCKVCRQRRRRETYRASQAKTRSLSTVNVS